MSGGAPRFPGWAKYSLFVLLLLVVPVGSFFAARTLVKSSRDAGPAPSADEGDSVDRPQDAPPPPRRPGEIRDDLRRGLDEVEALVEGERWTEAEEKMVTLSTLVESCQDNSGPSSLPDSLLSRYETVQSGLKNQSNERRISRWYAEVEGMVSNSAACQQTDAVKAALAQVEWVLEAMHGAMAQPSSEHGEEELIRILRLRDRLQSCLTEGTAKGEWEYTESEDPMGGRTTAANIYSCNLVEFGFPYPGKQVGVLMLRKKKADTSVFLMLRRAQFNCPMECTVRVRFDDEEASTWPANPPSDHSGNAIFLGRESRFLKKVANASRLRIEAEFFQEGNRVFEFHVAGLDLEKVLRR